ncbi:preprotein translocase subunit YajC [Alkalitalea saponilacus]|uniref:Sec translocon accessory complex subunit YajC n=1 Tax=Alkalitalea saponilacus TaxID=889453 RepID=A0A1T5H5T5_9BACT|nr:preprotein translocase subunit YajC [Alkalitalea saponilacus]ASB50871.1 preprotein translocase subunit YajC [Alkalitalea saponilacus]SKC15900.1 preprotein translocase subunit YajC [Alkalitalea saponilacus]
MYSLFLSLPPQADAPNPLMSLLPFLLIIVVFYFFMIRPQMKRQKELRKYREALKKGDKIITTGGIYGRVTEVKDSQIIMEIADDVKIRIDKSAVIMDMSDAVRK